MIRIILLKKLMIKSVCTLFFTSENCISMRIVLRNSQESSSFVKIYKINKHKICTLFKLWYSKNLICQLYFKLCTVFNFDIVCVAKQLVKRFINVSIGKSAVSNKIVIIFYRLFSVLCYKMKCLSVCLVVAECICADRTWLPHHTSLTVNTTSS